MPLTSHNVTIDNISGISGVVTVPGDKSISHRALLLASQVIGTTCIEGLLEGEDVLHTADALKKLGVTIEKEANAWKVNGVGIGGLSEAHDALYMGNSGTGVRLMMGLVSSYPFTTFFTGDESLSNRPMQRVITPLLSMGATFNARENNKLPLSVTGFNDMIPIRYEVPVPSAQVKSAILLAGLNIPGQTTVIEKAPTRDHTELMLRYLGVEIETNDHEISLIGQPELEAKDIYVPGDPSSAAFLVVAALITPGSALEIQNVCINSLRIGLYDTLIEMGADITFSNTRNQAGEKIADIIVKSSQLHGCDVPAERAPSMIDEYPILAIAAAAAEGQTRMNGLAELKVKESNRLEAIITGLQCNGVDVEHGEDWLVIAGNKNIQGGGVVETHMDHRIAMAFLVLGLITENVVSIDNADMISTSFPGFIELMNDIGARIE